MSALVGKCKHWLPILYEYRQVISIIYEHINVGGVSLCDKLLPDNALEQSWNYTGEQHD